MSWLSSIVDMFPPNPKCGNCNSSKTRLFDGGGTRLCPRCKSRGVQVLTRDGEKWAWKPEWRMHSVWECPECGAYPLFEHENRGVYFCAICYEG